MLNVAGAADGTVSQRLDGLKPGTYAASAWVSTSDGRPATLSVDVNGERSRTRTITATPPLQDDMDHQLFGKPFQRVRVHFTVPKGQRTATIALSAGAGAAGAVQFADVRVVRDGGGDPSDGEAFYSEDFEHVDQGWGPFVLDQPSEAAVHLSERHEGYTRDTISGDWSLKAANGKVGQVYRSWPGTIDFESGHAYRVRLAYQSDAAGTFAFGVGADGVADPLTSGRLARTTARPLDSAPADGPKPDGWTDSLPPQDSAPDAPWERTFVAGSCGDAYLALEQVAAGMQSAVIDDLVIDDLGPVDGASEAECRSLATVSVDSPSLEPGKKTDVVVTYTNESSVAHSGVTLTLPASSGLEVKAVDAEPIAEVAPGASVSATFSVTTRAELPAEPVWLIGRAEFTQDGKRGGATSEPVDPRVAYGSIAEAYDRVSITDDSAPAGGDFDGNGNSYSRQALEAAGLVPGGAVTIDQAAFTWPSEVGVPNSATSSGQTVELDGSGGAIGFLAAGGNGKRGTVTITYHDGSTSTSQVAAPNWCCTAPGQFAARPVASSTYNNGANGPQNQGVGYQVYYVTAPAEQGKTVVSVTLPDNGMRVFALTVVPLFTAPPAGESFVSDNEWTSATSGWGPVERDRSLGERLWGDGDRIVLDGEPFDKGIGMAPLTDGPSAVSVALDGTCQAFHATVGLDDAQKTKGSVVFSVVGDGEVLYESPTMRADSDNEVIDVDVTGVHRLELRVADAGDGIGNDHASWGDAKLRCAEPADRASASARRVDLESAGDWSGVYGSAGWQIAGGGGVAPGNGVSLDVAAAGPAYVWTQQTDDVRALAAGDRPGRIASAWHVKSPTFTVSAPTAEPHRFSFYLLDWDSDDARKERITIRDTAGRVLDTVEASGFSSGAWYSWAVSGTVTVTFEPIAGNNAVVSGVFVDPVAEVEG
nr:MULTISPECIES: NPCBM/NEW2 domain-containing protein [unclassified Microbacterium]